MNAAAQKKEWDFQRTIREAKEKKAREEGSQAAPPLPVTPPDPVVPVPMNVPAVQAPAPVVLVPVKQKSERALQKAKMRKIYGQPTGTVCHDRLPFFAATTRPVIRENRITENRWGIVEVTGKLGQNHRNFHDLIMTKGSKCEQGVNGELYVEIDPTAISKKLMPGCRPNPDYLRSLLQDMKDATVKINYLKRGERMLGGIVSEWEERFKKIGEVSGPKGIALEKYHWQITISKTWMHLYEDFVIVRLGNALDKIISMRCGYSMAIARIMLDQRFATTFKLDFLRMTLDIAVETKILRREILKDSQVLANLGISIEDHSVNYIPRRGIVSFWSSQKKGEDHGKEKRNLCDEHGKGRVQGMV